MALGQLVADEDTPDHEPGRPRSYGRNEVQGALSAFMRTAVPPEQAAFWLWPEHVDALRLWAALGTQWRVGMAGATGLDYTAVEAYLRIEGIRGAERRERFAELRIMERAALRSWAEQRQQAE